MKRKGLSPQFAIVFVLLALIVLWSALSPAFLTTNNLLLIIKQVTLYGILAVGMTLVIITGGIDLSVGSVVALSAVFAAHFASGEYAEAPLILPIAVAVGVGTLCGLINGIGIAYAGIPNFIMTMCMMLAAIFGLSDKFTNISNGFLGRQYDAEGLVTQYGVPYMVFYFVAAMIIGIILLQYTTYGRKVYAIGGNHEAARYSGLNVRLVEMSVYVISGLCSGICGFLMASRISSGNANSADGYEMTVISAVVIGGVSMSGGVGTMTGVMIGVLITGVISNGMDILGVNSYYQKILQAVIILVAVYIDGKINRRKK